MIKNFKQQFGSKIKPENLKKYTESKQWNGKIFENLSETIMDISFKNFAKIMKLQFSNTKVRSPRSPLPILPFDAEKWNSNSQPKFIWYGHSVALLQINGLNLLIDPMFGPDAAPIAPFSVKRFSENTLDIIDQLPHIDLVLLTHDHYDHLDLKSIYKLKKKVKKWFVAIGVGRHLEKWGIPKDQILEFDWWQNSSIGDIKITFTPARHFSGRGMKDRAKSFWGGWVFETAENKIYWSGDSGYDSLFKEIGKRFGAFDWAFMECGQYSKYWHVIHMYPEETVQASLDVNTKIAIPIHWGGFPLSLHTWKDPIERFIQEADKQSLPVCTPKLGQIIILGDKTQNDNWWEKYK